MRPGAGAAVLVAGAVAACLLPVVLSDAQTGRLAEAGVFAVAVLGLGLLVREGGRPSLGHGALLAAGGYATALLASRHGVAGAATLPAAAGAGAAAMLLAAVPVARLAPRYLALPTLGAALALPAVLAGYGAVELPQRESALRAYVLAWTVAGALVLAALLLRRRAARLPWPVVAALSGGCAGLAGGLLVLQQGSAAGGSFPARLSLLLAAAAALGLGRTLGAVLGGLAVEYLPDLVGLERTGPGPATFAFGVLLVAAVLATPLVAGLARRLRR